MFEKEEAFNFITTFLQVKNAESRVESNKRELLDEIVCKLQALIPFQNVSLLSVPPNERRKPMENEVKTNYKSGIGGICFDFNISTNHLLSAIGFEMAMVHCTVTTTTASHHDHVVLTARNVEKEGDWFLVDVACGHPTFRAVNLGFEKESPVYVDSYLEYKYIKHEGQILRMHRKGDPLVARGVRGNSEFEFWIDGWRRFYAVDLDVETKDTSEFYENHKLVYTDPNATCFHRSHRVVMFPDGKGDMVVNDKTYKDINGELVIAPIEGGDEGIKSAINRLCPRLPQDLLLKSLHHWRQSSADANNES